MFPSFCARELKNTKKNGKEEEVLTFLSGGAEERENGVRDLASTSGSENTCSKTVARTYDYALKKCTILEPAASKKPNTIPDDRFGATSTFISDQKVVQFGGVKKHLVPLKNKNKKIEATTTLAQHHQAAVE